MPDTATCRKPLDADRRIALRGMVARRAWVSAVAIGTDWAIFVTTAVACQLLRAWWVYALGVLILARQMNALSELHHHAMHGNLFQKRRWNRALQFLYSLPLGTTVEADLADHMEHHRTYNTTEKDYLSWGTGYGLDLSRRTSRAYMVYFLWIRPFLGPLQLAELRELLSPKRLRAPALRPVLGFWLLLLAGFAISGHLGLLFRYWIVPRLTLYPVLFFWEDMLGHYNCPLTGTRDFRGGWFRLFAAHGTAFHNVHHLCPTLPWHRMAAGTRLLVDETRIDVAHGFLDGMRQLAVARD
jgi:fatty acid desaturase